MAEQLVFTPTDIVASINQTLEYAYGGSIQVQGEIGNFRVNKGKWVYFDIKDELASIRCFGTVYQLPGPLEDGMLVHISAAPRLHQQFGFSLNLSAIRPVGEGALKRAADLLMAKLSAEGIFAPERKRALPSLPERIGLITSAESAAYADFIKVAAERWRGLHIQLIDVQVQGEAAPVQLVEALTHLNELAEPPDVIVMTRGGGSADDLAAFNDERLVRAVAASRVPTLIAIGHEIDFSLAELAADQRASTPSNAAQLLLPDRQYILQQLRHYDDVILKRVTAVVSARAQLHEIMIERLNISLAKHMSALKAHLQTQRQVVALLDPQAALKRGYGIIRTAKGTLVTKKTQVAVGDQLLLTVRDGTIPATVRKGSKT